MRLVRNLCIAAILFCIAGAAGTQASPSLSPADTGAREFRIAQAQTQVPQAASSEFPALTGRVVDEAGILDAPTREALTQALADLEAKSSDQIVVVTLRSLRGTSIEDYGYRLGRAWQIGQAGKNNGALLIVAPNERKVRIEVGYGLEGTLTDAITSLIIQQSILPRFRAGDFTGGIRRGVEDVVQVLTGDAEEYRQRAAKAQARAMTFEEGLVMTFFLLIAAFIILNVIFSIIRASRGDVARNNAARRGRRRGSWLDNMPIVIGPGGSSGGSWSGGGSGGGFSGGGGGSFGGGGSSGSW